MGRKVTIFWLITGLAFLAAGMSAAGASTDPSQSVRWGKRTFTRPAEFAAWLRARGLAYQTWAEQHRAAAARLEGRLPRLVEQPVTEPEPQEPAPVASETTASNDDGHATRTASFALLALAATLLAGSAAPLLILKRLRTPAVLLEHRLEFAGAGVSIALGLGISYLL
jgi:hypothetical protein